MGLLSTVCIKNISPALSTSRLLFGYQMTESKGRITLEYQFYLIYFFTKVIFLVLHFVKTINSNIINNNIQQKENFLSFSHPSKQHLFYSVQTYIFPNCLLESPATQRQLSNSLFSGIPAYLTNAYITSITNHVFSRQKKKKNRK